MNSPLRTYLPAYLAGVLVCAGLMVWASCMVRDTSEYPDRPTGKESLFNREQWIADRGWSWARAEMLDDLQKHYLRRGMTKADVVALLGEPGIYPQMPDSEKSDNEMLCYDINRPSTYRDYFFIELDSSRRVTEFGGFIVAP